MSEWTDGCQKEVPYLPFLSLSLFRHSLGACLLSLAPTFGQAVRARKREAASVSEEAMMAGIWRAWSSFGLPSPSPGIRDRSIHPAGDGDRDGAAERDYRSPTTTAAWGRSWRRGSGSSRAIRSGGGRRADVTFAPSPSARSPSPLGTWTPSSLSTPPPRYPIPAASPPIPSTAADFGDDDDADTAPPPLPSPGLPRPCDSSDIDIDDAGSLFDPSSSSSYVSDLAAVPTGSAPAVGSRIGPKGSGFVMAVSPVASFAGEESRC